MDKPLRDALCGAALLATVISRPAIADTVLPGPDSIQYFAEQEEDAIGRTCSLSTVVLTRDAAVNFRLIVALPHTGSTVFYGFSIDAGKIRSDFGLDQFQLADANVTAENFDSATSLRPTQQQDKGILKVTNDEAVGLTFVHAVLSGRFSISAKRAVEAWQTYPVDRPVPEGRKTEFYRCIGTFSQ